MGRSSFYKTKAPEYARFASIAATLNYLPGQDGRFTETIRRPLDEVSTRP